MVAIVGRPNVGKSTLFNRIAGRRKAVVLDIPGVTRDRNFEAAECNGRAFTLVDTGGLEMEPRDATFSLMREQCLLAIDQADVIIFLADVLEADNPVDADIVALLRCTSKPVILAVNKCDNTRRYQEAMGFHALGLKDLFAISSLNGTGVGDLLDRVVDLLPPPEVVGHEDRADAVRIAVIGRPNVGKSSLVNALLGQERVIVSEMPGTTRDTIDTTFRFQNRLYTLIDTAGLRRRGKVQPGIEKLTVLSAQASLSRCHVALVLIDAEQGLAAQDEHVAGYAHEACRGCVLIVNKWDLVEKNGRTAGELAKKIRHEMGYLSYAPILMMSAKTGQRVHRILPLVDGVYAQYSKKIDTAGLNEWLGRTTRRASPPGHKGKQLRIKYVVQTGVRPPTFMFFVNDPDLVHFSYERYLMNQLREAFGFEGSPLRLRYRHKGRKQRIGAEG